MSYLRWLPRRSLDYDEAERLLRIKHRICSFRHKLEKTTVDPRVQVELFKIETRLGDLARGIIPEDDNDDS